MVERQLPKLHTRVRFPSPAPAFARAVSEGCRAEGRRAGVRGRGLRLGKPDSRAETVAEALAKADPTIADVLRLGKPSHGVGSRAVVPAKADDRMFDGCNARQHNHNDANVLAMGG
jgi:hypothetical protein